MTKRFLIEYWPGWKSPAYDFSYDVSVGHDDHQISVREGWRGDSMITRIYDTREKAIRDALIEMGWTPPCDNPARRRNDETKTWEKPDAYESIDWSPKPGGDILADMYRLLEAIPPAPVFAQSNLFPGDSAWHFEKDGVKYTCAAKEFWEKIPNSVAKQDCTFILGGIEIVDIDIPANRQTRAKVMRAFVEAMNEPQAK